MTFLTTESGAPVADNQHSASAGALYRVMTQPERDRLAANIAAGLSQVSRDDIVERALSHFHAADPGYGAQVERAVKRLRAGD